MKPLHNELSSLRNSKRAPGKVRTGAQRKAKERLEQGSLEIQATLLVHQPRSIQQLSSLGDTRQGTLRRVTERAPREEP